MMDRLIFLQTSVPTFAACLLIGCTAVVGSERPAAASKDNRGEAEARSAEPQPPSDRVDEHVLSEIEKIRRRLGGDPFRGTIFENVKPADLANGARPAGGIDGAAESGFDAAIRAVAAQHASRNQRPDNSLEMGAAHLFPAVQATPVSALRQAARTLEDEAANLDAVGLYSEADRLRSLADQFWQKARQIEQPSETESETP
jgi:hypothetical protein